MRWPFKRGRVKANGIEFEYLEVGEGPLALCVHGFPDTPFTYRHLLPALAEAGFHAVAPFVRGFAPTELPPLRHHIHTSVMVADQMALAEALGGGPDALLVARDWGALGARGALSRAPQAWGRAVIMNIPPSDIFGQNLGTYAQIKKSFYFWYFQMQRVIEDRMRADDFAFVKDIWGDGSPGYESEEEQAHIREALADPQHLNAALGYYWGQFDHPLRLARVGERAGGRLGREGGPAGPLSPRHDRRLPRGEPRAGQRGAVVRGTLLGLGPDRGVGHFMLVERPDDVNGRILDRLGRTAPAS